MRLLGKKLLSIEDNKLTLNVVKTPKMIRPTIATNSPMLSKALFSVLNKNELFFELPYVLFIGCFILYFLILIVSIILSRTEPKLNKNAINCFSYNSGIEVLI